MKYAARTIFQNNEMLRHLNTAGIDRVAEATTRRGFAQGVTIFADGDPGDAIFGVIAGQVQITARTPANHQICLNLIGPGGVFGEIAVVDGLARCATAVAATDTEVFRICRNSFVRLMAADSLLLLGLLEVLCHRQRAATRLIIDEYSQGNVGARLAHGILRLTHGDDSAGRPDESLQITQAELAKYVFVSRQVVNQHLSVWESHGWVSKSRRRITVTDRDALAAVARNLRSGHDKRGNGTSAIQG